MIRRVAFVILIFGADYLGVALIVLLASALLHRASVRRLADELGVSLVLTLILVALQWPWLAWSALTRRAR